MPVLRLAAALPVIVALAVPYTAAAQVSTPNIVFRASVDVVSVTAVVRDRKGRIVPSLRPGDFQVLDEGQRRPILDLYSEATSPASIALLVDGSGSMRLGAAHERSRHISEAVLAGLDPVRDDAALYSFDTRLLTLSPFTHDLEAVRRHLDEVETWGSTSLFDAIAGTAGMVANRTRNRRAVVVLTDGTDTASEYSPDRVAAIASSIDVPIYVFALGDQPDGEDAGAPEAVRGATLAGLARATGGDYFAAGTPEQVDAAIARLLEELRHQYVIAFEATRDGGLHRIEVRVRNVGLSVRSRKWYATAGE